MGMSARDLAPRIPPGLGITRLGDLTGLDSIGLPVWSAVRPEAWSLAQSQGKGLTVAQAQIAALMEAAETHLAENACDLIHLQGTPRAMRAQGMPVPDLAAFLRCTDPAAAEDQEFGWLEAQGIRSGTPWLVPLPLVSLDFREESAATMGPFLLASSGLAAHPDRQAALRHGLLEQIETDAYALAFAWPGILAAAPEPDVPPDDPGIGQIAAALRAAGLGYALRDLTSTLGVPVVLCWLVEPRGATARQSPCAGVASRPTLTEAARDAMLEAVQSRLTEIAGAREDITEADYQSENPTVPRRHPPPGPCPSLARPLPPLPPGAEIDALLDRMATDGLGEPLVVDLSRRGDDFACVSVLCPGLETGPPAEGHRRGPRAKARLLRHALGLS